MDVHSSREKLINSYLFKTIDKKYKRIYIFLNIKMYIINHFSFIVCKFTAKKKFELIRYIIIQYLYIYLYLHLCIL